MTDWVLGGIGFSMATASASFAGYMIVTAPAEVTGFGSKDFNVFVRFDRRAPDGADPAPGQGARVATAALVPAPDTAPTTTARSDIDPTPTGSIPDDDITHAPRAPLGGSPPTGSLREFRLRNVVGDRALIEHRSRLTLVQPGSILAGAGEVLSIERQGGGWVVRTASGTIGGT